MDHLTTLSQEDHGWSSSDAIGLRLGTNLDGIRLVGLFIPLHSSADALVKGHGRLIPQKLVGLLYIGTSVRHIPGLIGHEFDDGIVADVLLHDANEFLQGRSGSLAEVEDLVRVAAVDRPHHAVDDIVDVGVIAAAGPVPELLNFDAAGDSVDELEGGHVGTSPGTVHREETERRHVQFVQVVVRVREELARLLGGGVRTDGIVDVLGLGEEGRLGPTVHGRRRGEDEILHAEAVRQFHQVGRPLDVGMDVHVRVLNGRADSRPRGHVTHPLRPLGLEEVQHEILVADVAPVDRHASVLGIALLHVPEVPLLDLHVVVVVHLVHEDDVVPALQQKVRHGRPYESRPPRDEYLFVSRVRLDLRAAMLGRGGGGRLVVRHVREAHGRFGPGDGGDVTLVGVVVLTDFLPVLTPEGLVRVSLVHDGHAHGVLKSGHGCSLSYFSNVI
mmetsp:Transcript_36131/g.108125  ORF Transcript_36131/g.108125 Transcript_36131/m.108125 type:complete len:444 (+) Transcript_36131:288-1619(+)